jgi:hypothetical protein
MGVTVTGPHEQRLFDMGLPIRRERFEGVDPALEACIATRLVGDMDAAFELAVRDTLPPDMVELAAEWFFQLIERLLEGSGLEADDWQATSWGGFQKWGRLVYLPDPELD